MYLVQPTPISHIIPGDHIRNHIRYIIRYNIRYHARCHIHESGLSLWFSLFGCTMITAFMLRQIIMNKTVMLFIYHSTDGNHDRHDHHAVNCNINKIIMPFSLWIYPTVQDYLLVLCCGSIAIKEAV